MSDEQLYDKYLECVGSIINPGVAQRTLEILKDLDALKDINGLVEAYRA